MGDRDKKVDAEIVDKLIRTLKEKCEQEKQTILAECGENIAKKDEALRKAKEIIEKLSSTPNGFGVFYEHIGGDVARVIFRGELTQVKVAADVDIKRIRKGQLVRLNENLNVLEVLDRFEEIGEEVTLEAILDKRRALVSTHLEDEKVAAYFSNSLTSGQVKIGDKILMTKSHFLVEKLPKSEVEELVLEEAPDVTYEKIGGLGKQIEMIKDAIELPYLHPEKFRQYKIRPAKGILLYGPPGCGKTLIAKAIANSLAERAKEKTGRKDLKGYFINIRGPELLTKWVGETERKIREVFGRAREKAGDNNPVIIFFDEMDAIFPMRGSGISSDVEKTSVTMFCTMLDGMEELQNIIIIGATNRQDLIDPAIVRPGRLDLKIKVERPDEAAAKEIFGKYLTPDLPLHSQYFAAENYDGDLYVPRDREGKPRYEGGRRVGYELCREPARIIGSYFIPHAVTRIYDRDKKENQFLEVTYNSGTKEIMCLKDFMSGAVIESIVTRSKKLALKRELGGGEKGIRLQDIYDAIEQEFKENQDLPNTTAGIEEWLRISGKRGERVVNVRTIIPAEEKESEKKVENVPTGHYL